MIKSDLPGSIRHIDGKELNEINKRMEYLPANPKLRQEFEDDIRVLVSILNANNIHNETIVMVNEKIRQHIQNYHNPVLIMKET